MYGPARNHHDSISFFTVGRLHLCQLSPQTLPRVTGLSNGSFFPSGLCQPVARQQRSHLSPLQHAENNLGCACACGTGAWPRTRARWREDRRKHNHAEPRRPVGKKLAITELGKPMLPCEEESDVI